MIEIKLRKNPFEKGNKYKVKDHVLALRDEFHKGEELIFSHDCYSHYDGMTGYVFITGSGDLKVFDISDSEDVSKITNLINKSG